LAYSSRRYLGMLQGQGEGFPPVPDGEPEVFNRGTGGRAVRAFHLSSNCSVAACPRRAGLVEEKWNLPALTARDAAANTPLDALDFTSAPAFLKPPSLPKPSLEWGSW
jgi:hypothetical protein